MFDIMDEYIKDVLTEISNNITKKLLTVNRKKDKIKFLIDVLNDTNSKLLELLDENISSDKESDKESEKEEGYDNIEEDENSDNIGEGENSDLSESEYESDLE